MKTNSNLPLLLYSYLATEMLAPFFASFIVMNCVFFLVKLIPFLNLTLDLNIGPPDFIRLFTYLFPNIFLYSIPMAAMIGAQNRAAARLSHATRGGNTGHPSAPPVGPDRILARRARPGELHSPRGWFYNVAPVIRS